jgi:hypothetical protein
VSLRLRCRQHQFRALSHPFKGLYIHCEKGGGWENEGGKKRLLLRDADEADEVEKDEGRWKGDEEG